MMMMRTMTNPVQPLAICSLLLLSLPSISAELDDMQVMSKMGWPAAAAYASAAIGNHTDPDNQSHHGNALCRNILGYTLVGIVVLMFFFAVVTFGRSCCIQWKNVSLGFCYSCVACSHVSSASTPVVIPHHQLVHSSMPIQSTVLHCVLTTRLQGMLPIYAR